METNSGKQKLLAVIEGWHPSREITPIELEQTLTPLGIGVFVDSGPGGDGDCVLYAPGTGDAAVKVKTMQRLGGDLRFKAADAVQAVAVLLRTGPPVWERSPHVRNSWWLDRIREEAADWTLPKVELDRLDREGLEKYIANSPACQKVWPSFLKAANAGHNLSRDRDLRDLIDRAERDTAAASAYYESLATQSLVGMGTPKPARKKAVDQAVNV